MNPFSTRFYALCTVFTLVAAAGNVAAKTDVSKRGTEILALVQAFYDKTRSLEASFIQERYTKLYDRKDRATGRVTFKKPGRMRWDYAAPQGQVLISDGKTLSIYQPPQEGEKHGQLIEREVASDALPQAFSFLLGQGKLEEEFVARLLPPAVAQPANVHVLQLLPKNATPYYEQLVFYVRLVEAKGRPAAVIQRILIIDEAGNRNRFDFQDIKFNRAIPKKRFSYKAPKGTHRVRP